MARHKKAVKKAPEPLIATTPDSHNCNQAYQFLEGVVLIAQNHSLVDPLDAVEGVNQLQKLIVDKDAVKMMGVISKVAKAILSATSPVEEGEEDEDPSEGEDS